MVDLISRKPVQLFDVDLEVLDHPRTDVLEFEDIGALGAFVTYRADQPRTPLSGQRKHSEKVSLLEIGMEFAVNRRPGSLDVRDIEQVPIGAAWKPGAHRLAHDRV